VPWKETGVANERLKFIAAVLSGEETMVGLCGRFGISLKTGYKWRKRYQVNGAAGLLDLSRGPHTHANAVPESTRERILTVRQQHPTWGARKVRARPRRPPPA